MTGRAGRRIRVAAGAVLLSTLTACGPRSDAAAAPQADEAALPSGTVRIDAKMLGAITVDAVSDRDVTAELTVAARVQFDEDRLSRVVAPVAGQIVDLRVKVGDRVSKGQTLCAIASRDAAAAAGEYLESQKDLELAEKTAAMTEDLFQHEAASRIALQQSQSDLAKARSRAARTAEALRVLGLRADAGLVSFDGRIPIVAPIAGTVIERKVTEGQFEQADSAPIMTVADSSVVWVVGDVFERDLHVVRLNQPASIATAAYPGDTFHGRVNYISDSIDPATRSAKVRVTVPNRDGRLKPEMFASIALGVGGAARGVAIPASAIFVEDGRTYVYAEVGERTFARKAIEVSPGEGANRRVVDGLTAGERIVTAGALLLRQQEDRKAG